MSKKVKTRRDESRFQKPKSIHIWVIFGICLLIMVQAILFFLIMQSLFAGYLFNSKITDEYISIEKMAKMNSSDGSKRKSIVLYKNISAKLVYSNNKKIFDKLFQSFQKNGLDIKSFIEFFIFEFGKTRKDILGDLLSVNTLNKYAMHMELLGQ